jgi:hypothetical protein
MKNEKKIHKTLITDEIFIWCQNLPMDDHHVNKIFIWMIAT